VAGVTHQVIRPFPINWPPMPEPVPPAERSAATSTADAGMEITAHGGEGSTNVAVGTLSVYTSKNYFGWKVGWRAIDEGELAKARSTAFVNVPERYREQFIAAESSLDARAMTILRGEVGTGRRTDAIRLLSATAPGDRQVYELLPDWETPGTIDLPTAPNTRYLLELSDQRELPGQFGPDLIGYARRLQRVNSQITVTATARVLRQCVPLLDGYIVDLPGRDAEAIIKAIWCSLTHRGMPWACSGTSR